MLFLDCHKGTILVLESRPEHIILFMTMNLTGVWHFLLVPFYFSMFVYGTMQYSQAYHQHQQAQSDQLGRRFPVPPKHE